MAGRRWQQAGCDGDHLLGLGALQQVCSNHDWHLDPLTSPRHSNNFSQGAKSHLKVMVKEFKTEQQGAAQCSQQGARHMGALCPDHLGGKKSKPDAVFLRCKAGYFFVQTSHSAFLTEGERVCLHPSLSFPERCLAAPA